MKTTITAFENLQKILPLKIRVERIHIAPLFNQEMSTKMIFQV